MYDGYIFTYFEGEHQAKGIGGLGAMQLKEYRNQNVINRETLNISNHICLLTRKCQEEKESAYKKIELNSR